MDRHNGNQLLWVNVVRWGVSAGQPVLADARNYYNYTNKEVRYVIALGAIVADVREGVKEFDGQAGPTQLIVLPNGTTTGPLAFAPGDAIEQAVGDIPWNPTAFRARHFDNLPTYIENASFLSQNSGTSSVTHGLALSGLVSLADAEAQFTRGGYAPGGMASPGVAYQNGVFIGAVCHYGIRIFADISGMALAMEQSSGNLKRIGWGKADGASYATLGYDLGSSTFQLVDVTNANPTLDVGRASVQNARGLSGSTTPASNLRGIDVTVAHDATSLDVVFDKDESNAAYAMQITPSWLTQCAVTKKTPHGFTVAFGTSAPVGATVDWFLVR